MNGKYVLTTTLKTRDAVEATANHTLKNDLGYQDILARISRQDYWEIALSQRSDPSTEQALMVKLAEETRVFVNPNKHIYEILPLDAIAARKVEPGIYRIPVAVRSIDDRKGTSALKTLVSLYGYGEQIKAIGNGVLWTLDIQAESMTKAMEIAERIVVTNHRRSGLLANPHYETVQLYK